MENEKCLSFKQAKEIVRMLSKSQGFYCRVLQAMNDFDEEQIAEFEEDLAFNNVKNDLDLVFYFEC